MPSLMPAMRCRGDCFFPEESDKLVWQSIRLRAIAGKARQDDIVCIIRSAATGGHEVVDLISVRQIHGTPEADTILKSKNAHDIISAKMLC